MEALKKKPLFNENGDIDVLQRRMINGNPTNLNDFNTLKYNWVSSWYRQAMNNFWIPEEVNLGQDVKDYRNLTKDEKKAYDKIISFLVFLGIDVTSRKPNLVVSSGFQVCWEKFCVYWDIEMRLVPMDEEHMSLNIDKVLDYVDDYTIGVVALQGITYTGKFDDIKALDALLEEYNKTAKITVPIHVDAASGGLFTPFINPEMEWDFRLKNVVSISTSGHKYGLVYPGIGWVIWKDEEYLPKELIFEVSYLGGTMPTMAINFSRSASQVIGQYYNFLRLGFEGYRQIHQRTKDVAMYLADEIEKTGLFKIYNNGENLPIVCYRLKDENAVEWTLYDLADRLAMKGWQIPAYPLPINLDKTIIQRIVCRADLSRDMAELFIRDLKAAIKDLNNANVLMHGKKTENKVYGFTH